MTPTLLELVLTEDCHARLAIIRSNDATVHAAAVELERDCAIEEW